MIGWENNQGAYFINKLSKAIKNVSDTIGKLSSLATTYKTSIVGAINEVFNMAKNVEVSTSVTMEEGFSTTIMKAYQQGKIVVMDYQFSVANLTANTTTKIGTIKASIKPKVEQFFTGLIGTYSAVGSVCKFILKDDGSIMISVPSNIGETAQAVRGVFVYESV